MQVTSIGPCAMLLPQPTTGRKNLRPSLQGFKIEACNEIERGNSETCNSSIMAVAEVAGGGGSL